MCSSTSIRIRTAASIRLCKALASGHRNLCVVGDDDQSIYGWRGAEVTHILRFAKDWPDAKIVRLEDNYRSTEEILGYANTLIAFNRERHKKVLKAAKTGGTRPTIMQCQDETQEAERVVADIRRLLDTQDRCSRAILRFCAARTSSRGRLKRSCGGRMCRMCSSAACRSSIARKFATSFRI